MTTVALKDGIMASDGRSTMGDMITDENIQKVHSINGCLVGYAGRLTSGLQFLEFFERWTNSHLAKSEMPHIDILVPDELDDEDFTALVLWGDGTATVYEGGRRTYEVNAEDGYAIGSGSPYAFAAMDAGATAEEAVRVAIKRDIFSGGQVFVIEQEPEEEPLNRDIAESMGKEELLDLLFGKKVVENSTEDVILEMEDEEVEVDPIFEKMKPISDSRILGPTEYELEQEFLNEEKEND